MHDIAVRTAEHCCIRIPGRACVECFVTCLRPPSPSPKKGQEGASYISAWRRNGP